MRVHVRNLAMMAVGLALCPSVMAQAPSARRPGRTSRREAPATPARRAGQGRTGLDHSGRWGRRPHPLERRDTEIVRILGIDTPEVRRLEHNLPYDQPFGPEARAFAQGAFAAATDVELLRSATLDPYGRTLAYLFINGRNFSVLAIKAGYSGETVSHYGDNGLPREAAEVLAVAKDRPHLSHSSRLTCIETGCVP